MEIKYYIPRNRLDAYLEILDENSLFGYHKNILRTSYAY